MKNLPKMLFLSTLIMFMSTSKITALDLSIGAGAGYIKNNLDLKSFYPIHERNTSSTDINMEGTSGRFFAELGKTFNEAYYLGVILSFDISNAEGKERRDITTPGAAPVETSMNNTFKYRHSFGGSLKMGYRVVPKSLIYVTLGVVRSNWDISFGNDAEPSNRVTKRYNLVGFRPSVGADFDLTENLKLGIEGNYTLYGKNIKVTKKFGNTESNHKVTPRHASFMVNLTYKIMTL